MSFAIGEHRADHRVVGATCAGSAYLVERPLWISEAAPLDDPVGFVGCSMGDTAWGCRREKPNIVQNLIFCMMMAGCSGWPSSSNECAAGGGSRVEQRARS